MTQPVVFDVPTEVDVKGMRARMDAIRLKQILSPESLSERELLCLQMEQNGFGCGGSRSLHLRAVPREDED
jgi:hypothetical protein